jgi:hypothetical protein
LNHARNAKIEGGAVQNPDLPDHVMLHVDGVLQVQGSHHQPELDVGLASYHKGPLRGQPHFVPDAFLQGIDVLA